MKEVNEPSFERPTEEQVNDMYSKALLNFYADAQDAKQDVNKRYARIVKHFGNYKQVPKDIQYMLRQEYVRHEAKWSDNGEEMQKRFGVADEASHAEAREQSTAPAPTEAQLKKQEFIEMMKNQRNRQNSNDLEYSR